MSGTDTGRGRFISFEGGEGAGKSTQAAMLAQTLVARGIDAVLTREPGGTPGAEAIRRLLLDPAGPDWGARAEALLFAAARADHVARLIEPALAAGRWVVCDRFIDSSRAYQGGAEALSDADLIDLHRIGSGGLLPDATVLIELAPGAAAARIATRDAGAAADRIGGRDAAFHAQVAARFAALAIADPARFRRVDGAGSVETVHDRVLGALAALIAGGQ